MVPNWPSEVGGEGLFDGSDSEPRPEGQEGLSWDRGVLLSKDQKESGNRELSGKYKREGVRARGCRT